MKLFLDTNILLSALTQRKQDARQLLDSPHRLLTNEYVIKEIRRALADEFNFSAQRINDAVDEIRLRVLILPTPPKDAYARLRLRDMSDAPIVLGAQRSDAVFVSDDKRTREDAQPYVQSIPLSEVPSRV